MERCGCRPAPPSCVQRPRRVQCASRPLLKRLHADVTAFAHSRRAWRPPSRFPQQPLIRWWWSFDIKTPASLSSGLCARQRLSLPRPPCSPNGVRACWRSGAGGAGHCSCRRKSYVNDARSYHEDAASSAAARSFRGSRDWCGSRCGAVVTRMGCSLAFLAALRHVKRAAALAEACLRDRVVVARCCIAVPPQPLPLPATANQAMHYPRAIAWHAGAGAPEWATYSASSSTAKASSTGARACSARWTGWMAELAVPVHRQQQQQLGGGAVLTTGTDHTNRDAQAPTAT